MLNTLKILGALCLGGLLFGVFTAYGADPTTGRVGSDPRTFSSPTVTKITASGGVVTTGGGTCTGTDTVVYDNNGVVGCQKTTDTAPLGTMFRPQPAFAGGTQTAAKAVISAGQDETKVVIDAADPSVTCPGDTVTVTVIDSNGTHTATVLTEGAQWAAVAAVATTCSNLATAVEAIAGVGATCSTATVRITLDTTTAAVILAESDGNCTGVDDGTQGGVQIASDLGSAIMAVRGNGIISVNNITGVGDGVANLGEWRANTVRIFDTNGDGLWTASPSGGDLAMDFSASSVLRWSSTTGVGGAKDVGLERFAAGQMGFTDGSTGVGQYLGRLVNAVAAVPAEPLACAAGTVGTMTYVDDTNDAGASYVCICMATDDVPTYDWVKISDFTTACTAF